MSLRSTLAAIGKVFKRKKSSTPLRVALEEFARAVTPKATRPNFSQQQRTLTKLAQRMLTLSAVAGAEDSKVIAGSCTLLAGGLTKRVRGEARANDDDWRWLARWPELLLNCLAGGYNEAEAMVCHLLEPSWAELLSPVAVHVLLDRLKQLSDAPGMASPELMSLYEQYCSRHQAGDQAANQPDEEEVSEWVETLDDVETVDGLEKVEGVTKVEGVDAAQEDAAIAADGAGLVVDAAEALDSVMESPMVGYVPAEDIAETDHDSFIHAFGDAALTAITAIDTEESDSTEFDPPIYDTTILDTTNPGTAISDAAISDAVFSDAMASTTTVQPEGEPAIFAAQDLADKVIEDEIVDHSLTGSSEQTADSEVSRSEETSESMVQDSIDDASTGDEPIESPPTMEALSSGKTHDSDSQIVSERDISGSGDVETSDASHWKTDSSDNESGFLGDSISVRFSAEKTGADSDIGKDSASGASIDVSVSDEPESVERPAMLDAIIEDQANDVGIVGQPDFSVDDSFQLPLPEIAVAENVAPGEFAVSSELQPLSEIDLIEAVDAIADDRLARDEATADMFDKLEATADGDEDDVLCLAALKGFAPAEAEDTGSMMTGLNAGDETTMAPIDSELTDHGRVGIERFGHDDMAADDEVAIALRMLDEQIEAVPSLDDIFDAFDDIAVGDGEAMNLDDFVLEEEAPTTINDDVPVAADSADIEQPGLPASLKSAEFESNDASKDAAGAGVVNDAAELDERSLQNAAPADRKMSRAAMQIVEVMLAELPQVEAELGICVGVGESTILDRKVVGEAVQRCAEVLKRYGSAADSVGFIGLARIVEIAREHVLLVAQIESLSDRQVGLLSEFTNVVRAYFEAPHAPESAQSLLDWITDDGWATPATIDTPEVLLSLLANPDLSAIDEDAPGRQQRANPEDVSLAVPADANGELLDGLLQELPVQSEEFSAAIERLMHGTGTHEDILVAQRIAHTIKGSGNTVGIRGLAALTHNIEDILLVLAQEKRLPSQPLANMLMNAADRLQAMTESLLGMGPPPDDALDVLQSVLDWANLIDREGLPPDDTAPEIISESRMPSSAAPGPALPAVVVPAASVAVKRTVPVFVIDADRSVDGEQNVNEEPKADRERKADQERKVDQERKSDQEFEALLRVPARLVDRMLTTAGESIILTGQLRDRVRRSLADLSVMFSQFERQQQLGGELEELIDVKDFSRRQVQHDSHFDALEMDQYNELHSSARQLVESATDAREMGRTVVDHLTNLDEMLVSQEALNRDAQDTVLHTRMVGVQLVFPRLKRAVRQTCRATEKQVELHLSGGETPMDSDALSRIVDPLMHLLRNAIDHGIEDSATRLRHGKAATGNVYLDFQRDGNNIVIRCRDDGAGLDYDAIRHVAEERGLLAPDASLDALKQIILRANFSTRAQTTQVSGRGIGLDAVHDGVSVLGGTMTVESETGQGCSFELRMPFNLITSHAVLVRAGPNLVALASRGVEQIIHGRDGEMQRSGDKTVFQIGDDVYPAATLESVIGAKYERREGERHVRPVVLTRTDEGVTAVSVEAVIGSRDLVVKSLGKILPKIRGVVGATILGDGQVASVIDLPDILSNREVGVEDESATATDESTDSDGGFVLVVDDSLSARRALAQCMQDSGYRVRSARDGVEATQIVDGARPDLVLADLEMPRMNGIELTAHLRSNAHTADVPVIMVTSRSTTKHREQAQAAGVNVYLIKPYSEDTLIETVRGLIGEQEAKRRERPAA